MANQSTSTGKRKRTEKLLQRSERPAPLNAKPCPREGCKEQPVLSYSTMVDGWLCKCPTHGTVSLYKPDKPAAVADWNRTVKDIIEMAKPVEPPKPRKLSIQKLRRVGKWNVGRCVDKYVVWQNHGLGDNTYLLRGGVKTKTADFDKFYPDMPSALAAAKIAASE